MMQHTLAATPHGSDAPITEQRVLGLFETAGIHRLEAIGRGVLRYGLVALLLLWGVMKFWDFEAQAILPLLQHHPLMSWMPTVLGVRGASALIGVIELVSAGLICTRRWRPSLSAIGSLIAAGTFVVTLSFLATTPNAFDPASPWGPFLMKDLILLGAAIYTAAEALGATVRRAHVR